MRLMLRVVSASAQAGRREGVAYQWLADGGPLGLLAPRAECARTPPLQLGPRPPIRLVTGLRPPPRPITGPRLEYRVWVLYVWYGTC